MDTMIKEVVRYLGYGKTSVDEQTLTLIYDTLREVKEISEPKSVYQLFNLNRENDDIKICNMIIHSKHLQKNLEGCSKVVLFATTLGAEVDRRLYKYEITDIARAVVLQACAAAVLENYCDQVQNEIARSILEKNQRIRPRYSPGYGDCSIEHQREVLALLDTSRKIGLSMTESYMLTPSKSVTAFIGIYEGDKNVTE